MCSEYDRVNQILFNKHHSTTSKSTFHIKKGYMYIESTNNPFQPWDSI